MEPYVLNLRNPYDDEMKWALEDPAPHQVYFYNEAIMDLAEELGIENSRLLPDGGDDIVTDGGRPRKYFFTWMTENGNLLYDASVNGDAADVFYESETEAEEALERLIDAHPEEEERYRKSNLYKVKRMDKVMEGVEVMTEQQGLSDFAPDGGHILPEGYDQDLSGIAESAEQLEW